jgi:CheY-like chemotaxis protein
MTPAVKARVLEPFFTTKDPGKGTGLGLPTIYGFVTQSGGQLTIETSPGAGSTISLYLPRSDTPEPATSDQMHIAAESSTAKVLRVLVVDDNDSVRKVTIKRLQSLGHQTFECDSGTQAIRMLSDAASSGKPVDLVFTDIVMERNDSGYELAGWIREHQPKCRIMFTSAYNIATPENMRNIPLLQKPYSLVELKTALMGLKGYTGKDGL